MQYFRTCQAQKEKSLTLQKKLALSPPLCIVGNMERQEYMILTANGLELMEADFPADPNNCLFDGVRMFENGKWKESVTTRKGITCLRMDLYKKTQES